MNGKTMMYIIDRNYRFLYMNPAFQDNYPKLQCGQRCHKMLGDLEVPCGHCPLPRPDRRGTFYNETTGEWIRAEAVEMEYGGDPDCFAVFVKAWQGDEDQEQIAKLTEEIRLQKELLEKEHQLQVQQEEHIQREQEQKQILTDALAQAEYASHAKTVFLNNMSHDIRTPMNAILGMTAIAAMHIDDKTRVMDALNKITISGKHLLGIINSVLDMARIESGRISLNEEEFELPDLIESLLTMFYQQMAEKGQELKVNIVKIDHEHVIGDDQRLQQILVNIMGNAVKYTPKGGQISLDIREKHSEVTGRACYEFVIADNGIGMSEEFVEHIFEPFARASESATSKTEGTGLGMAIAANVARLMGGDIQVESELGKGSRFTVEIYLKLNDVTPEDLQMLVSLPVLVVDDEELACESACEILNSLEMQAEYVLNGQEAVERVRIAHEENKDFSVVILDWKMPGMDGVETAKAIRSIIGESIPIIILSAYDWSDIEQEAIRAGVNAFIEKPLFKSRLTHVLKDVLGAETHLHQKQAELEAFCRQDHSGKRILLAEDNELNVEVASELLGMAGLLVEPACNGREALEKLQAHPGGYYDLVFMDIQMPEMDGYEATRAIRELENEQLANVPVIAMTANAFWEDRKKAKEAGMDGYMAKPIDVSKLMELLDRMDQDKTAVF